MGLSSSETKWIIFVSYAFTLGGGGEKKASYIADEIC